MSEKMYICDDYNEPIIIIEFMGCPYIVYDYDFVLDDPSIHSSKLELTAVPMSRELGRFTNGYRGAIEKVIFNDPATIVYWKDGTKTVVKCQPDCEYSKYAGFMACVTKKVFGNKGNFNDTVNYWLEHGEDHSDDNSSE